MYFEEHVVMRREIKSRNGNDIFKLTDVLPYCQKFSKDSSNNKGNALILNPLTEDFVYLGSSSIFVALIGFLLKLLHPGPFVV